MWRVNWNGITRTDESRRKSQSEGLKARNVIARAGVKRRPGSTISKILLSPVRAAQNPRFEDQRKIGIESRARKNHVQHPKRRRVGALPCWRENADTWMFPDRIEG